MIFTYTFDLHIGMFNTFSLFTSKEVIKGLWFKQLNHFGRTFMLCPLFLNTESGVTILHISKINTSVTRIKLKIDLTDILNHEYI